MCSEQRVRRPPAVRPCEVLHQRSTGWQDRGVGRVVAGLPPGQSCVWLRGTAACGAMCRQVTVPSPQFHTPFELRMICYGASPVDRHPKAVILWVVTQVANCVIGTPGYRFGSPCCSVPCAPPLPQRASASKCGTRRATCTVACSSPPPRRSPRSTSSCGSWPSRCTGCVPPVGGPWWCPLTPAPRRPPSA